MARLIGVLALALASAALLAGCGGSSSGSSRTQVSPTAYVSALCEAVAPFERDVATRSGQLSATASATPSVSKTRLVAYLGALAQDSSAAVTKLDHAGIPNVSGGPAFARTIVSTFSRLQRALARSRTLATALTTTSPARFAAGATQLATAVKESVGQLGTGLSTRSNPVLDRTAAKLAVCHTL
jgi:hypothetical protein